MASLASYAGSYVNSMSDANKQAQPEENDFADYDMSKRRVEWKVKNFRGQ